VAEVDAPLRQVVRRHLDRHAIARENTDAVLLHPPRRVGDHLMPIVEFHAATSVRQDFVHHAFELEHFFFGHLVSRLSGRLECMLPAALRRNAWRK
jgi:hypothetical protein